MIALLRQAAAQFAGDPTTFDIKPLGTGLINDTYWVGNADRAFVLQRINAHVFPRPDWVMDNLRQLSQHIRQKPATSVRLRIPAPLPTQQGDWSYQDQSGHFWRALQLIAPAESRNHISHAEEAAQIGFALAHFHHLCADLTPDGLHDTLPGFHVTPNYLQEYMALLAKPLQVVPNELFRQCQAYIEAHQDQAHVLENAKTQGVLPARVIHGDPKLSNFLFEPGQPHVISLIDLDTVKPGLLHYDIGDCLRSCCHDKQNDQFDLTRCQIILESYLQEANDFFSREDYDYLYAAIWLIPFELGLRFFNDYLDGNRYFKTVDARQNVLRAHAQFALCESIAGQRSALEQLIVDIQKRLPKP